MASSVQAASRKGTSLSSAGVRSAGRTAAGGSATGPAWSCEDPADIGPGGRPARRRASEAEGQPSGRPGLTSRDAPTFGSGLRRTGSVLVAVACFIGFSRVAAGVHYPTDILGGIAVAAFSVWGVHRESSAIKRYLPDK